MNHDIIIAIWNPPRCQKIQESSRKYQHTNVEVRDMDHTGLLQRPDAGHGYWGQRWQKTFYYLAYAFAASGYVPRDIPRLLSSLKGYNQKITLRKENYYLTLPAASCRTYYIYKTSATLQPLLLVT